MTNDKIVKLLNLDEAAQIFELYCDMLEMLKKGEVDQFRQCCEKTAELAAKIHQQMEWDQTSGIYSTRSIQIRLAQYDLGSTGFYNHIHLIRLLVDYLFHEVVQHEARAQENIEKNKISLIDLISTRSAIYKKDSDVNRDAYIEFLGNIQEVIQLTFDEEKLCKLYMEHHAKMVEFLDRSRLSTSPLPGVITFLDVLGWKGIYQRKADAISQLQEIISMLREKAKILGFGVDGILDTEVLSISDTIVISTRCLDSSYSACIDYHGFLCADILPIALDKEIPLRGAVCCGKYAMADNIFVGPAVDEAASWHELADWIGICMSPSAAYHYQNDANSSGLWMNYRVAFKDKIKRDVPCLKWKSKEMKNVDVATVREILRTRVPIFPEVFNKYNQTCDFLKKVTEECPDDITSSNQEDGSELP